MNSLAYISRQFDVLASTSVAIIRSAPPTVSNRHSSIHDENTLSSPIPISPKSPSRSLPEIRTRRASQPSSLRGRSKAQAFLHGPRRRTLSAPNTDSIVAIDPADVPLPPSPPISSIALPQSDNSSPPTWSAPGEFLSHSSSPSPASTKRRRRRTVSAIVLRPFLSMWHILLSMWLWLIGDDGPANSRRLLTPAAGRIKHMRTEKPVVSSLREKAALQDANADEQSDATLVDSDDDDENKRSTLVEINGSSDAYSHLPPPSGRTPSSSEIPQDHTSSGSIFSHSSLSNELTSILRRPDLPVPAEHVHVALPSSPERGPDANRTQRWRKTPWPSQERIVAPEGCVEPMRSADSEDEEAEVDEVLMRRRKRRLAMPTPTPMSPLTSPSLSALDLNIPAIHAPYASKEKGEEVDQGFPPRTIITPPSSDRIRPPEARPSTEEPPDVSFASPSITSSNSLKAPPSQTLLPNLLGNSYLTGSSSSHKSHRSSPDHTETPASRQPARSRTPFHQPKTLVLDLDETLIHSTSSRAPPPSLSSSGGGSGGMFNELGGIFLNGGNGGGFGGMGLFSSGLLSGAGALLGKGGDRARAGHMIEVVLNGRSTLYTVYKRPFVDYFLRKVKLFITFPPISQRALKIMSPCFDRSRDGTP